MIGGNLGAAIQMMKVMNQQGGGQSWEKYWNSLISATVEDAAPDDVVLTFPDGKPTLTDTDFTIAGKTITDAVWIGAVLTLTVSVAFDWGDTPVVTFVKTGQTANVTNNILYPSALDDANHWWYDATDLTTITKDGSDFVSVWAAKGGAATGKNLAQGTGANQPLWVSPGTIRFDGVDNFMKSSAFTWNQPCYYYALVKQISFTDNDVLFDGNSNYYGAIYQDNPTPNIVATAGTVSSPSSDLIIETWGIIRVLFNGASSKLIVNDNIPIAGDFGAINMGGFTIGSRATGTGLFSNFEVKDIVCCNTTDAANETEIYNWLVTRIPT